MVFFPYGNLTYSRGEIAMEMNHGFHGRMGVLDDWDCAMMRFWMLLWRWLGWGVLWILLIIAMSFNYSYEFQLFLLFSLLSLHVTMQMSLLLLCPCSHMFSLIFSLTIVVYRCWLSLLSTLGDSPAPVIWSVSSGVEPAAKRPKKKRRNRGESPASKWGK